MLTSTIAAAVLGNNLSPNRESGLPGFQEGGVNANLRHLLTDFGSGYQGNVRQLAKEYKQAFEGYAHTSTFTNRDILQLAKDTLPYVEKTPTFLGKGYEHSVFDIGSNVVKVGPGTLTGFKGKETLGEFTIPPNMPQFLQPIKSNKLKLGNLDASKLSRKAGNESNRLTARIHAAETYQRRAIEGLDPYYHVLPKVKQEDIFINRARKILYAGMKAEVRHGGAEGYAPEALKLLSEEKGLTRLGFQAFEMKMEKSKGKKAPSYMRPLKKEMIRQTRQTKQLIRRLNKQGIHFADAHAANVATYQGRTVIIDWGGFSPLKQAAAVAKSSHLAPGRQAVIEGLSHGGVAQVLRKTLTSFGSPWQGLPFEPQPYSEENKRRRSGYGMPYGMTPGQAFDVADIGVGTFGGFQGTGVLGWNTAIFGGLDLALSAGTAAPEEMAGRTIGAVAAQAADVGSYFVGNAAGGAVGAAVGGVLGGGIGAIPGEAIGSFVGGFALPFVVDPMVRKISKPINRLVGSLQHRVQFGGFIDSQPAYTMRMRALQELRGSLLNATQWLGREGQLMHG